MNTSSPVICFGEILWDILPTGDVPGGAPMNVAYHLNKLGHSPAVITRIGKDERGTKLIALLKGKKISTGYVQVDKLLPTGIVYATPNEHKEMEYDIVAPVAWDVIEWSDDFPLLFNNENYFVYGSLIARNLTSRDTLFRLLEVAKNKVLDINLRPPHYDHSLIRDLLLKANIAKVNYAELNLISSWFGEYSSMADKINLLSDKFNLDTLIVTKGGDGAIISTGGKMYEHPGFRVVVQDTVGSGDSFLAAVISGFIEKRTPAQLLEFACAVGALVTSKKGGWPEYELKDVKAITDGNVQVL
ncbi:MAG TPA: carbohydrate kinase [Flavitalea sp.]|nr:carbohydrate kinase [Flavitalea sp.]